MYVFEKEIDIKFHDLDVGTLHLIKSFQEKNIIRKYFVPPTFFNTFVTWLVCRNNDYINGRSVMNRQM